MTKKAIVTMLAGATTRSAAVDLEKRIVRTARIATGTVTMIATVAVAIEIDAGATNRLHPLTLPPR